MLVGPLGCLNFVKIFVMVFSLGADHAGFELRQRVKEKLEAKGIVVFDHGTYGPDSVDYPDFAHLVAQDVVSGKANFGIVICGSGNGINMAVNKHAGIRSALCWTRELAELAKQHNDANVLALPARFISEELALDVVEGFLSASFEGGRHQRRVDKINC